MCVGERCGLFRRYTVTDIFADRYWMGRSTDRPDNPNDIKRLSSMDTPYQHMVSAAFERELRKFWDRVDHTENSCPRGCICIETHEVDGAPSKPADFMWTQPLSIPIGSTSGTMDVVVVGAYRMSFTDYVGKCLWGIQVGVHPDEQEQEED